MYTWPLQKIPKTLPYKHMHTLFMNQSCHCVVCEHLLLYCYAFLSPTFYIIVLIAKYKDMEFYMQFNVAWLILANSVLDVVLIIQLEKDLHLGNS